MCVEGTSGSTVKDPRNPNRSLLQSLLRGPSTNGALTFRAHSRKLKERPGDFVYRYNEASHAEDTRKLGLKWERPYEVVEALGKGAYKLRNGSGAFSSDLECLELKKCYI
ncbi:hypothetical protein Tco_0804663 [Tanacetum coccineum]|uniref:Reverse transcriptase domain-containing protein n=1 Tax=Tanacetum coccineum TaxID=301880 RepID=A0ABQ5A4W3_9ASTR